jgi:hypothetical protein
MNGIHEVTGSTPVWSTISKSLIPNGRNRRPTPLVEPPGALTLPCTFLTRTQASSSEVQVSDPDIACG